MKLPKGYTFALVPVYVKNNTKSTESLTFVTWTLEDDEGYSYSIQTMADKYLSEDERLNVTDVPPESTRYGYIIFQVRESVNDLYLGLETTLGNGKWHFKINYKTCSMKNLSVEHAVLFGKYFKI